jgi:Tfp pilus assembly protein PilN
MSRVNLLPPELLSRQRTRRVTSLIALGGVLVLVLLGLVYFLALQRLSAAEEDLAAQEQENAELASEIGALQPFADAQTELAAKQQLVRRVYVNEVSWSAALLDISRVIPDPSYLTAMTGQVLASTSTAPPGTVPTGPTGVTGPALVGSVTFQGVGLGTDTIATWLTRLEQIEGWENAWVSTAQEDQPLSNRYAFTSAVDLSEAAVTDRGRGVAP